MFLVEIWNSGTSRAGAPDFRVSTEYYPLTYQWHEGVAGLDGMSLEVDTPHGGMVRNKYGILTLIPTILATDFISLDISYSNTNEAAKKLLFRGVGYVNSRTRTSASFDLFTDVPNVEITADIDYTGGTHTLISIFQAYCTSAGWTLNSSLADTDVAHIAVDFTARKGQLFADMLSALCATYSHYFVIDAPNTTIHLRDIMAGAGTTVVIDEFTYLPSKYSYNIPPSKVTIGDSTVYGNPYYFGNAMTPTSFSVNATVNAFLAGKIKDIYTDNPYEFELYMPMEYFVDKGINFVTLNKIQWSESSVVFPSEGAGSITYNMVILSISFSVSDFKAILRGYVTKV